MGLQIFCSDFGALSMPRATLEQRVAELERQVAALLASDGGTARAKDWRRTLGAFTGDDLMKQIFAEGPEDPRSGAETCPGQWPGKRVRRS